MTDNEQRGNQTDEKFIGEIDGKRKMVNVGCNFFFKVTGRESGKVRAKERTRQTDRHRE